VLGPDGAGKSTLIESLRADLAGAFRRSQVFHLQPDILGQKEDEGPVTEPHAKPPHPVWLSLLKIPYYVLDYSLGYALRVRPQLVRSTLVLFDRYYDDILVDARRYRYGGPLWLVHWLQRAIPRPDLFLILDAPAEQLLQRKQELPGSELQRQRLGYHRLAMGYQNAYVLHTSAPIAEVARQASAIILDFLHARYLQRRHLWLGKTSRRASPCQAALALLLNLDEGCCLRGSEPAPCGPHEGMESAVPFGLVALGDGRGYLVPLQSRRAAAAALTLYNPQTLKARIGRRLLKVGLRLGVGQPFLKRTWFPMRRIAGPQQAYQVPLLAYLQDLLGQGPLTFAVSLGTPGPHRKPVVQMMDSQGHILGYAKIGQDETSNALVQNEVRVLQALATTHWQAFSLPTVLATAWWRDHALCVLSAPKSPGGRLPHRLTPLHLQALNELWAMQTVWMPLPLSAFWLTVTQHAQQVHHAYYRGVLEHGMARAEEWLATVPLPFCFSHGDFTPWNLQRDGPKLFIVDWECASAIGSPMWDLCHFIFQTFYLVKKWDAARICRVLVDNGPQQQPIASALRRLGLTEIPPQVLVLLYCLERLAFWALREPRDRALLRSLSAVINFLTLTL
jgi:thymidylate kinase